METTPISQVGSHIDQQVTIHGFVQVIRDQGSIKFLLVRDITGVMQCVVLKENAAALTTVSQLSVESVVEIVGTAKTEKQAPGGTEIAVETITILSHADPELPIPVIEKGQEEANPNARLDWRWLDLRKPKNTLVFKVWTLLEAAFREFWIREGYIEIHSPKLIATASESGSEVFEVKYFDRKAFLAQSPQFYKQMAMAAGFEKVFEVGPVFRAEPSFTSRHATEFTGFDTELSYITSHEDVMQAEERAIAYVIERVRAQYGEEIRRVLGREVVVPTLPFPRLTMKEAKAALAKLGVPGEKDGDLNNEEEKAICQHILDTQQHEFLFVTEYPVSARPFYHMRSEQDPTLTKSFDLLWNGLEVTTGAQREHRYDILLKQAKEVGMKIESIQFYLDFFKYGCPPHGGYGMGPNRMVMKLLGLETVRDAMFLYRGVKRLEP